MKSIELNGIRYTEGSKCPSCSSEVDNGGRFEIKKRKRHFLKCSVCKYTILGEKTKVKIDKGIAKRDGLKY